MLVCSYTGQLSHTCSRSSINIKDLEKPADSDHEE